LTPDHLHPAEVYLERISKDMKIIREQLNKVLYSIHDAESEVPEKMRRFIMYMHDVHDIMHMYTENGIVVPDHVMREPNAATTDTANSSKNSTWMVVPSKRSAEKWPRTKTTVGITRGN
jgi:hypothetical protein